VTYEKPNDLDEDMLDSSPVKPLKGKDDSPSDLDFANGADSEAEEESDSDGQVDARELESKGKIKSSLATPKKRLGPSGKPKASASKGTPKTITLSIPSKSAKQQGSAKRSAPPAVKKLGTKGSKPPAPNKPSKVEAKQPTTKPKGKALEQKNPNIDLKQKKAKIPSGQPSTPSQPVHAEFGTAATASKPTKVVKTSVQEQADGKKKPSSIEPHSEEQNATATKSEVKKNLNSAARASNPKAQTS
jgi:hypothetical protein